MGSIPLKAGDRTKNKNVIFNMMIIDSIVNCKSVKLASRRDDDVYNHRENRKKIIEDGWISGARQGKLIKALNINMGYLNGENYFCIPELKSVINNKNFVNEPETFTEDIANVIEPLVQKIKSNEKQDYDEVVVGLIKKILVFKYESEGNIPPQYLLAGQKVGEIESLARKIKLITRDKIIKLAQEDMMVLNNYIEVLSKQLELAKAAKIIFSKDTSDRL